MHRSFLPAALVLVLTLTSCGSDDSSSTADTIDTAAPTAPPADTTTDTTSGSTVTAAGLTVATEAPPSVSLEVVAADVTTDRTVRRGAQSNIEQGQTFAIDADETLSAVSFHVVAPDGVPAGQAVELAVYEVGDTTTMVPSGVVALAETTDRLVLTLDEAIPANEPVHLVFEFPGVKLAGPGQYAAVLSLADGSGPAELFVQHAADDVLVDGTAITLDGATWKANNANGDTAITVTFA